MELVLFYKRRRKSTDWRERNYYLVNFNQNGYKAGWWSDGWDDYGFKYEHNERVIKSVVKSLKRHSPYNHFVGINHSNAFNYGWDAEACELTGMGYVQHMVSCKKTESKVLEEILQTSDEIDYFKLSKEVCNQ